jgi:hypothetical protein
MTPKLQNKLYEKYPEIFNSNSLQFGIECDDGWYTLIDTLCAVLQNSCNYTNTQIVAVQVKEKFGGLRFYTNDATDYQEGLINFAEIMSYSICESCGTNQNIKTTVGWVKTLCKDCKDKHYPHLKLLSET